MSLEEEKVKQTEWAEWLLNGKHKAELWEILAFGEKYKKEWEEMEREFWSKYSKKAFTYLILQYEESKRKFEKRLSFKGRKIFNGFNDLQKKKFYEKYLLGRVVYSWDTKMEKEIEREKVDYSWKRLGDIEWFKRWVIDMKDDLNPWMLIGLAYNDILEEWARAIAEAWKGKLKPWMIVGLGKNKIWDEWAKVIAKEWKRSLQLWIYIYLWSNEIWDKWIQAMAREWKDSLQPWMKIDLQDNEIWDKWIQAMAREWKDKLKPWMWIVLDFNQIWDEWIKVLSEEWKDSLKPWMEIDLSNNKIWDDWAQAIMDNLELKEWVKIDISGNNISDWKIWELKKRAQWWYNCLVLV